MEKGCQFELEGTNRVIHCDNNTNSQSLGSAPTNLPAHFTPNTPKILKGKVYWLAELPSTARGSAIAVGICAKVNFKLRTTIWVFPSLPTDPNPADLETTSIH
jgi:hypothetical protein